MGLQIKTKMQIKVEMTESHKNCQFSHISLHNV